MPLKRDPNKALQYGFLALLGVSTAQVGWWIYENVAYTSDMHARYERLYEAEARAVEALLDGGGADAVREHLPHLAVDEADGRVDVAPGAHAELNEDSAHRINLYLWEGGFFIAVLLGGMAVLTRAIRHDAELRRRQQNFLAAVSHEFKSPLASMRLAAETLVMRAGEPESRRLGQRILEDDERLLQMVDNLLDTTRLEEGRHTLKPETTQVAAVVDGVLAACRERARAAGIELGHEIDAALELDVDRAALETMLRNLVDNALKACAAGGGSRVDVRAQRDADRLALIVSDDGLGFEPDEAGLMFDKFYRAGDELRRSTPGTGLGLYIVRRLARLSGAEVSASSAGPGRGAEVRLTWPASARR